MPDVVLVLPALTNEVCHVNRPQEIEPVVLVRKKGPANDIYHMLDLEFSIWLIRPHPDGVRGVVLTADGRRSVDNDRIGRHDSGAFCVCECGAAPKKPNERPPGPPWLLGYGFNRRLNTRIFHQRPCLLNDVTTELDC